jgi:hypothetical protein
VRQGRGIDRAEFGLVQVGLEHALLEVVEHNVAAAVDLHLLAGQEGQAVELLGLAVAQLVRKALDGVVLPTASLWRSRKSHERAVEASLRFDGA